MDGGQHGDALRAFEQTCLEFEVPATRARAEAALLDFRRQENPIPACRHILEHSGCLQAQFQAVLTLREAALRSWGGLGAQAQAELRSYLLHFILRHADAAGVVLSALIGALAAVLKRGWPDAGEPERQAFFAELEGAAQNAGAPAARRAALQILAAVVTEFSPATASPLGQAWEFHERCRAGLEARYLQSIFVHAVGVAQEAAPAAAAGGDAGVCAACVRLLSAVLAWEFRHPSAPPVVYGSGRPSSDSLLVRPGAAWRELLLAPEATDWLVQLLGCLRGATSPLAADARGLLVTLCSLSGDVFPAAEARERRQLGLAAADDSRTLYLRRLLLPVLRWLEEPARVLARAEQADEGELLDACRATAAAAAAHRGAGFEAALPPGSPEAPAGFLPVLGALTEAAIGAGGAAEEAAGGWLGQATELLLDAWGELCLDDPGGQVSAAAGGIFAALVRASLQDFAAGAFQDEEEGEAAAAAMEGEASAREQALVRAAALGRAAAGASLLLLASAVQEQLARLQGCIASGADPSAVLEELCWAVRMGAHLAADPGEGETPLPPLAVAAAAAGAGPGQPDALEALSHALLAVFGLCLDAGLQAAASPRLMEAAAWAAARWADTYLLPTEPVSPAMQRSFGSEGNGGGVLQVLVAASLQLLGGAAWAGEVDLHRVVLARLLPALVRRRTVCRQLVQLPAWQQLAGAFAAQGEAVQQLAAPLQRALARVLCQAAVGLPDAQAVDGYIGQLFQRVADDVRGLARPGAAQQPGAARGLDALLHALRGAAGGTTPRAQAALWAVLRGVLDPLAAVAAAFRGDAGVTCLLLKLAGDVVEAHVPFLEAGDVHALCAWVLQLLRQYSAHARGRFSAAAAKRLRDADAEDAYRDLRALLRLLTHLTARDMLDFRDGGAGPAVDVAQAVFLGLEILVPLMGTEQLKFPKLSRAYFTLLSYMLEVYPERVAGLPEAQIGQVVAALRWGLASSDLDVCQPSLEALAALARFNAAAAAAAANGGANGHAGGALQARLEGFLEAALERLLVGDDWRDVVDAAADCLLPLLLSHQPAFQRLGERLVGSQTSAEHRGRVADACQRLLGSNGVTASLERANRRRFRANLAAFVGSVRELVRMQ